MRGVTLVEMAIVLLILGILTKAVMAPLSAVQGHRQHREATSQLESIRRALWAHVVAGGVLPCPVVSSQRDDADAAICRNARGGVPARRLGLSGALDADGALLDPWNKPYNLAISLSSHEERGVSELPDWTSIGEVSRVGIADLSADIVVCTQSVANRCPDNLVRASGLAFVVFSTGPDDSTTGDQSENLDADSVFTAQESSIDPEHPFDDLLLWGTAAETIFWLLRAGWLP